MSRRVIRPASRPSSPTRGSFSIRWRSSSLRASSRSMPGRAVISRSAGVMAEATVSPHGASAWSPPRPARPASARMSRAVRMPTGRCSASTTTRPVTPRRLASAAASATVRSGPMVYGWSTTQLRWRLTRRTSSAWASVGRNRWITPSPPSSAMAMAMGAVVTVSMLAETMGMASSTPRVKRERVETCRRERMLERRGTSRTSSKVRARRGWSVMGPRLAERPAARRERPAPDVARGVGHAEVVAVDGQADPGRVAEHQVEAAPGLEGAALAGPWGALEGDAAVGGDPGPGGAGVAQGDGHVLGGRPGGGGRGRLGRGGGRGGHERRLGVALVGPRPQQPPQGHEQDDGDAGDGHAQPVGAAPAGPEAPDGLGGVLEQRGRVDPQVAGVGAQEPLGVDAAAQLAEALLLERLEVARPDPGRERGFVERLALRFPSRAQRFADGAQRGHPFVNTYRGNAENRLVR